MRDSIIKQNPPRRIVTAALLLTAASHAQALTAVAADDLIGPPPQNSTTPEHSTEARILIPESADTHAAPLGAQIPAQERRTLGRDNTSQTTGTISQSDERSSFLQHWAVRTVGALGIVIGLAMVLRLLARSVAGHTGGIRGQLGAGGRAPSGVLSVLARFPIARGQTLVLLQLDRRIMLLSQTPTGFVTLTELIDPEEVASIVRKCEAGTRNSRDGSAEFDSMLRIMERDHELAKGPLDGGSRARSAPVHPAKNQHDDPVSRAQAMLRSTRRSNAAMGGGVA